MTRRTRRNPPPVNAALVVPPTERESVPLWLRQHNEPADAYARFLWFAFYRPTQSELTPECINDLDTWQWQVRAEAIWYRLQLTPESPQQAATRCAQDALIILRRGLEAHAARACVAPLEIALSDLTGLAKMMAELQVAAAARAVDDPAAQWDWSDVTPEERIQFAVILSKLTRRGD